MPAKQPALSAAQRNLLQEQVFDDTLPGPLLHDFQELLAHIPVEGLRSTGKYNLLPIPSIPVLDARLTRPLRLRLTRPQLRSHPHLTGLYLLARATGLIQVAGSGAKARLVIDAPTLERWNALTPCERYCTLLEAWWVFGRAEMIGDSRGGDSSMLDVFQLWQNSKTDNWDRIVQSWLEYLPRNRELALCDLFGLVAVEAPDKPAERWRPTTVAFTPFGNALLTLVAEKYMDLIFLGRDHQDEEDETREPGFHFGALQPVLQPVLPGYQNALVIPPEEAGPEGVYVYKVSLGKVWRRIAMRHEHTLHALLTQILKAFNFDWDHLYAFRFRDQRGQTVEATDPRMDDGIPADDFGLYEVLTESGQTMDLTYDFGDNWKFKVLLERIDPPGTIKKLPKLLEQKGKAPEQYPNWD